MSTQITDFSQKGCGYENIFVVKGVCKDEVFYGEVEDICIIDYDDYIDYSFLRFNETTEELGYSLTSENIKYKEMETKDRRYDDEFRYMTRYLDNYKANHGPYSEVDDYTPTTKRNTNNRSDSTKNRRRYLLIKKLR